MVLIRPTRASIRSLFAVAVLSAAGHGADTTGAYLANPSFTQDLFYDPWAVGGDSTTKSVISRDSAVFLSAPASMRFDVAGATKAKPADVHMDLPQYSGPQVGESIVYTVKVKASRVIQDFQAAVITAESRFCQPGDTANGCKADGTGWWWKFREWKFHAAVVDTTWRTFTVAFKREADSINVFQLVFQAPDSGSFWIDDILFKVTPAPIGVARRARSGGARLLPSSRMVLLDRPAPYAWRVVDASGAVVGSARGRGDRVSLATLPPAAWTGGNFLMVVSQGHPIFRTRLTATSPQ